MAQDPDQAEQDQAVVDRSARVPRTRVSDGSEDLTMPHPSEGALLSGDLSVAEVFHHCRVPGFVAGKFLLFMYAVGDIAGGDKGAAEFNRAAQDSG